MDKEIVILDFAGTLIKPDVVEEANRFRAEVLMKKFPAAEEHSSPEELYRNNRQAVEKLTSLKSGSTIKYRKNDLGFMELSGMQVQNQISTNLFQIGMYMQAAKHKHNIFVAGMIEQLQRMQETGYKLAIISGIRTDIISGVLEISGMPVRFDYIYGQPPVLGEGNQEQDIRDIQAKGRVAYAVGDKMSDLERVRKCSRNASLIFARWGHASGAEEKLANHIADEPKQLEEFIK